MKLSLSYAKSIRYLRKTSKRAPYLLVTAVHASEINEIFDIVATPKRDFQATYSYQSLQN